MGALAAYLTLPRCAGKIALDQHTPLARSAGGLGCPFPSIEWVPLWRLTGRPPCSLQVGREKSPVSVIKHQRTATPQQDPECPVRSLAVFPLSPLPTRVCETFGRSLACTATPLRTHTVTNPKYSFPFHTHTSIHSFGPSVSGLLPFATPPRHHPRRHGCTYAGRPLFFSSFIRAITTTRGTRHTRRTLRLTLLAGPPF